MEIMLHLMCQRERDRKKTEHKNVGGLVVRCITGAFFFHLIRNLLCETEHDRLKNTSCFLDFLWDVRKRYHVMETNPTQTKPPIQSYRQEVTRSGVFTLTSKKAEPNVGHL